MTKAEMPFVRHMM